ncbi:uncharacterized protein PRCAT00001458001 [Priceomyces carsonii]|uniref:uncharacterized protein n=1 Tax=Priceomyces carsonii TaxID=28549 RepID=UPI002ED783FB|nr:unnamed protein product [Priceomyces carsonii]
MPPSHRFPKMLAKVTPPPPVLKWVRKNNTFSKEKTKEHFECPKVMVKIFGQANITKCPHLDCSSFKESSSTSSISITLALCESHSPSGHVQDTFGLIQIQ